MARLQMVVGVLLSAVCVWCLRVVGLGEKKMSVFVPPFLALNWVRSVGLWLMAVPRFRIAEVVKHP